MSVNKSEKKVKNAGENTFGIRLKKLTGSKGFSALIGSLLAIAIGLIAGLIVMLISDPSSAFQGFAMVLTGGFSRFDEVLFFATPIMLTGLSVGFAYKMGLFNIGASGQYTMGLFFAIICAFKFQGLPSFLHCFICIIAGTLGGMLWGAIPGIFKAFLNVNEVITSIMFNYIGMYVVNTIIMSQGDIYNSVTVRTRYIPEEIQLFKFGSAASRLNIGIVVAVFMAIVLYIVLNKTTFGYELRATGFNNNAATYAGMNSKKNTILTMAIAGALSGLGGALYILSPSTISGSSMTYEPVNRILNEGFNGIAVALLGVSNPVGIVFSSTFVSFIQRGGSEAARFGFKPDTIDIVIAVTIYCSAFATAVRLGLVRLVKHFRKNKASDGEMLLTTGSAGGKEKDMENDNDSSGEEEDDI